MDLNLLLDKYPIKMLEMLTGKLLGDGNLTDEAGKRPRLRFSHSIKDSGWCFHCYKELKDFLPITAPVYRKINDSRLKAGYSEQYYVQSKTTPILNNLKPLWYKQRKKILPYELLEKTMTPLALAWWYQDDGHLKIMGPTPLKIVLSTDSFDPAENTFLRELLFCRYNLSFNIDGQNRLVLYNQKQIHAYLRIVNIYIHKTMGRKTIHIEDQKPLVDSGSKRTTIYLPALIKLNKPTEEIHKALENVMILRSEKIYEIYTGFFSSNTKSFSKKGYQVTLYSQHLSFLHRVRIDTGMNMSEIVSIGLMLNKNE
ncbi:endonuclease [Bacillus idriensis]|uniref:Endonuclease n=1 Tax=Metabacillus idriensis TaxID=324768 RepID=A0A6I2M7T6_9BACI|nr:endonuclease [Metabacillus idriensis]MRX54335.1 endonuclease [Metabacillus idriensis]